MRLKISQGLFGKNGRSGYRSVVKRFDMEKWLTGLRNGQQFLQGNNSLSSGVKRNGCYVVPNPRSVFKFPKRKETVVCMGKRNGTVTSEEALNQISYKAQGGCFRTLRTIQGCLRHIFVCLQKHLYFDDHWH